MKYFVVIFAWLPLLNYSCITYMDNQTNSMSLSDPHFKYYSDSNIFKYRSKVIYSRDSEKYKPKEFDVPLPKKIRFYEVMNSSDFGFYYDNSQVIFIKTSMRDNCNNEKVIFREASGDELKTFISDSIVTGRSRYDIKEIVPMSNRSNFLFRTACVSILIYNIKHENLERYMQLLTQFQIVN